MFLIGENWRKRCELPASVCIFLRFLVVRTGEIKSVLFIVKNVSLTVMNRYVTLVL